MAVSRKVSCIFTAIEVASPVLFFIYHMFDTRPKSQKEMEYVAYTWVTFMFFEPVVTGAYVWIVTDETHCDKVGDAQHDARCHFGKSYLYAIGVFRVFGT